MRKYLIFPLSLLSFIIGTINSVYAADGIAIIVDSEIVTQNEWKAALSQAQAEINHLPPAQRPNKKDLIDNVVNYLAISKIQTKVAKNMGLTVSNEEVMSAINDIAKRNNATIAQLKEYLVYSGMSFESYQEEIRSQMLMGRIQREVAQSIHITEDELDVYMRSQEFKSIEAEMQKSKSPQVKVAHILIKIGPSMNEHVALMQIDRIKMRLDAGEDFEELAKAQSQDPISAANGGQLGWATKGQFAPEFEKAMFAIPLGILSAPVKTAYGYHLIKVEDRKAGGIADDAMLRTIAREHYFRKKATQVFARWQEKMLSDVYVERRI